MYDVIIIGMGMAGITAGIYAKRAGHKVLMFEKSAPGGVLNSIGLIKNYPGYEAINGPDLAVELLKQVKSLEIPYKNEAVLELKINSDNSKTVRTPSGEYAARNVIIATGRTPKYLGLDNEKDFLGKGLSTCATCDGFLYRGEDVAVVGSGNSALSESLYLSSLAKTVYLLHRGIQFKGEDELVAKIKSTPNIKVIDGVNVAKINETDGKISSVTLDNGNILNVKGVFIYIGYKPDTEMFNTLNITNIDGDIVVNNVNETSIEGLYAIGDCIKKSVYQLVTAASDGAVAVANIDKNN